MCTARAHCAVHVLMLITVCEHFWVKGRKMLKDMGGYLVIFLNGILIKYSKN